MGPFAVLSHLRCILADHSDLPAMPLHTSMLKSSMFSGDECTSGGDEFTPGDNVPSGILASYLATDMCVGDDAVTCVVTTCIAT